MFPIANTSAWRTATRKLLQCDDNDFFRVNALVQDALTTLKDSAIDVSAVPLARRLEVLSFQDSWVGCQTYAQALLNADDTSILLPPTTTICTPAQASANDLCCSLEGLWDRCCLPRSIDLPVRLFPSVNQQQVPAF